MSLCCLPTADALLLASQIDHLAQTSPELHAQLAAIVAERGPEAGGHLPAGLAAPEGGDNVATNMQAQSDYLRDMVVSRRLDFCSRPTRSRLIAASHRTTKHPARLDTDYV